MLDVITKTAASFHETLAVACHVTCQNHSFYFKIFRTLKPNCVLNLIHYHYRPLCLQKYNWLCLTVKAFDLGLKSPWKTSEIRYDNYMVTMTSISFPSHPWELIMFITISIWVLRLRSADWKSSLKLSWYNFVLKRTSCTYATYLSIYNKIIT